MKNRSKSDGAANESVNVMRLNEQSLDVCGQAESQPTKNGNTQKTGTVFFKRPKSPIYVKQFGDGGYEVVELWPHMISFSIRTFGEHFGLDKEESPVFITEAQYNRAKKLCLAKLLTKSI